MEIKKLFVAILGLVLATPIFAQYYTGRPERPSYYGGYNNTSRNGNEIYYGLRLGMGLGTIGSDVEEWDGPSSRTGLNVGAVIGFQLSPATPVYLESGLFYTEKGGRSNNNNSEIGKVHFNINYLELPILVKYCFDIEGTDFSIQPFAGGYLALGISGKIKRYVNKTTEGAFSDDYFKRFDGGLRIGCGAEYQMIYVDLAYEFGLANIGRGDFSSTHTGCFYLNCGVNF